MTAHLDHLGVGAPDERGDSIYNGADDNASGVAGVLAAARAFARLRPRTAPIGPVPGRERRGDRDPRQRVLHPPPAGPVRPHRGGRQSRRHRAELAGRHRVGRGRRVLVARRARCGPRPGEHADLALTVVDDQWPDRTYFETSDQIWFARRGVPSVFFSSSGPDAHYHRPSDEPATIEADFTARIARLAAWTALRIADEPARPRWVESARRSLELDSDRPLRPRWIRSWTSGTRCRRASSHSPQPYSAAWRKISGSRSSRSRTAATMSREPARRAHARPTGPSRCSPRARSHSSASAKRSQQ